MLARMAGRRTWVFWARGSLLSAVCGHWIANILFDAREFTRAGLEYTWRANISILIQTLVVLIVVALLGHCRRVGTTGTWPFILDRPRPLPWRS